MYISIVLYTILMESLKPLEDDVRFELTSDDEYWLRSFGVGIGSLETDQFSELISQGSQIIDDQDYEASRHRIISARQQFFEFLGIEEVFSDDNEDRPKRYIPISTFIKSQREIYRLGLDPLKLIETMPKSAALSAELISARVEGFNELGLNATSLINEYPSLIGFTPESVRSKMDSLAKLGLDAFRVIKTDPLILGLSYGLIVSRMENLAELQLGVISIVNRNPAIIRRSQERIKGVVEYLAETGLDVPKVIQKNPYCLTQSISLTKSRVEHLKELKLDPVIVVNAKPGVLLCSKELVNAKLDNLNKLGLDAIRIINKLPAAIGYLTETVNTRMRLIERTAELLKWEGDPRELVNGYPALLGFSIKKLQILRRIAAESISEDSRDVESGRIRAGLIVPLERYIVGISDLDEGSEKSFIDIVNKSRRVKLGSEARKWQARDLAIKGELGRVGIMYLRYIKVT